MVVICAGSIHFTFVVQPREKGNPRFGELEAEGKVAVVPIPAALIDRAADVGLVEQIPGQNAAFAGQPPDHGPHVPVEGAFEALRGELNSADTSPAARA